MEEEKSADELSPDRSLMAAAVSRLTDDLIVEILSRLPFRSVCRFKCVSKAWRDLIAHPAHRKKLPQTLAGVLYITMPGAGGFRHHLAGAYADDLDLDPSLAFLQPTEHRCFRLRHACNGLLLCSYYPDAESQVRFVVCNPATRRWAELPPARSRGQTHAAFTSSSIRLLIQQSHPIFTFLISSALTTPASQE
ncbi:F-box protein At2g16450-like [Triticum dicoccoides]|uniref:F-box protein At2g16450-like n=1 Tax=Triticum dicoccoides TaxID=85692 RepID=UPI00188FAD35|nr:F-box protein At2g16450-like [Triticum dicoccoides]